MKRGLFVWHSPADNPKYAELKASGLPALLPVADNGPLAFSYQGMKADELSQYKNIGQGAGKLHKLCVTMHLKLNICKAAAMAMYPNLSLNNTDGSNLTILHH